MGLYLNIALVTLEESLRRMFLCMKILVMLHDMYMVKWNIVVIICFLVSLMNMCWTIFLKYDIMYS